MTDSGVESNRDRAIGLLALEKRRLISASPKRVFTAWTNPAELKKWWGPENVRCISAEIDLRVGGRYRIANEMPDKTVLWIEGVFEQIEEPSLLVFTWRLDTRSAQIERVTVRLLSQDQGTEVIVRHERISTSALRDQHLHGWLGCLDGLAEYLSTLTSPGFASSRRL
ncbi:MAG: SRPBCC domain-containing protein [Betaproteobacteria bacterium]